MSTGQFIKKARGPFLFTVVILMVINYLFELNFGFIHSLKSTGDEVAMSDIYHARIQDNSHRVESRIAIIDIDTLKSRSLIAALLGKLDGYQPAVLAIDLFFSQPDISNPLPDLELLAYARSHPQTIFASIDSGGTVAHSFFLTDGRGKKGLANLGSEGESNTVRSLLNRGREKTGKVVNAFALEIVRAYAPAHPLLASVSNKTELPLRFLPYVFPDELKAEDILNDSSMTLRSRLAGKILLVGTHSDAADRHRVPNAGYDSENKLYTTISGLHIQALATAMLLDGTEQRKISGFVKLLYHGALFLFFFFLLFYLFEHHEFYFKLTGRLVILAGSIFLLLLYVRFMRRGIELELAYSVFLIICIYELLEVYHPVLHLLIKTGRLLSLRKKQKMKPYIPSAPETASLPHDSNIDKSGDNCPAGS